MRVFNLTKNPIDFHGRTIPPDGGSLDYPEISNFLPLRDRKLEEQKVLSFGALPLWWRMEREAAHWETLPRPVPRVEEVKEDIPSLVAEMTEQQSDDWEPAEERRSPTKKRFRG